jgi:hypothetical protein
MTKKHAQEPDRAGIVATLGRWSRGRVAPPADNGARPYVAPSRKNRKSMTTWQDEAALKELRVIASETGISQQELVAEGLNYVLTKYRKRSVAR